MRVLRVCHAARDPTQRARERALVAAGVDVTLAVPGSWPEPGSQVLLSSEPFRVVELPIRRCGDVNRHAYCDAAALSRLIDETRPDVLDLHEEPYSVAANDWLGAAPRNVPVVMYSAQNIDKRFPPPFCHYEAVAHQRVAVFYPCSRQAASVLRGKGFGGVIDVLPLGYDQMVFTPGAQSCGADEIVLIFVGRLVREKGADDAVRTLARVHTVRPARLICSGRGPAEAEVRRLAATLGVADRVDFTGWQSVRDLAASYRSAHVLLVPSRPTQTWAEQFGRVVVEAQASGVVVAGYACGAIPEAAGDAGLLVEVGDSDGLADGVCRLLADPSDFARLREAGRELATSRTWDSIAARHLSIYRRAYACASLGVDIPRAPRRRRALARAEFGQTASVRTGQRPFALPLLRRGGPVARGLAGIIDVVSDVASHLPR